MSRSLQQLAQEAMDIQNACNLSAVVHSFSRAMTDLGEHVSGTDAKNKHPIAILYCDKIAHLSGYPQDFSEAVSQAYAWAMSISAGLSEGQYSVAETLQNEADLDKLLSRIERSAT